MGQARRADHRRLHTIHQDVLTPLPQESPQAPIPVDKRAVRRTGVDHRYVGVPPQQRVAIADPVSLVQAAQGADGGLQRGGAFQSLGAAARQSGADTHGVQPILGHVRRMAGGNVPQAHRAVLQFHQYLTEAGELGRSGAGAAEMGKNTANPQVFQCENLPQLRQLVRRKTEPAKAGVYRQMHPGVHVQCVDGLCLRQTFHGDDDTALQQRPQQRHIVDAAEQQKV